MEPSVLSCPNLLTFKAFIFKVIKKAAFGWTHSPLTQGFSTTVCWHPGLGNSPLRVLGVVVVGSFFCAVGYSSESQLSTPWMSVAPLTPLVTT